MSGTFRFGLVTRMDANYVYVWSPSHRLIEAIIPKSEVDIQPGDVVNYQQSNNLSIPQSDSRIARVTKHDLTVLYHPKETSYFRVRTTLMIPEGQDTQSKQIIRSGPYTGQCVEFFAFSVEFGKVASFVKMECSPRKVYRGYISRIPMDVDPNELDTLFALVNLDLKEVTNAYEIAEAEKRTPWHNNSNSAARPAAATETLLTTGGAVDQTWVRGDGLSTKPSEGLLLMSDNMPPRSASAGPVLGGVGESGSYGYQSMVSRPLATVTSQPNLDVTRDIDIFGPPSATAAASGLSRPVDLSTSQPLAGAAARHQDNFDLFEPGPRASFNTSDGNFNDFTSAFQLPKKLSTTALTGIDGNFDAFDPIAPSGKQKSSAAASTGDAEKTRRAGCNRDADMFGTFDSFAVGEQKQTAKERTNLSVHFEDDYLEGMPSEKPALSSASSGAPSCRPLATGLKIVQPEVTVTLENFLRAKRFMQEAMTAMDNEDDVRSAILNMHKALAILQ